MTLVSSISGFSEVVGAFGRVDGGQQVDDGVVDGVLGAPGGLSQAMLEL